MTTREARGMVAIETEEASIASYLQHNPDFFERHQAVLTRLRLPHVRGGSTVLVSVLGSAAGGSGLALTSGCGCWTGGGGGVLTATFLWPPPQADNKRVSATVTAKNAACRLLETVVVTE